MKTMLKDCPLFMGIEETQIPALLDCLGAREIRVPRGAMILAEGDPADCVGVLLSGSAQVVREDYDGNRSILTHILPGELFAEAFACGGAQRMPVSVTAQEDSSALLIPARRILTTCTQDCGFHHRMIFNVMRILAMKNIQCNRKIEILSRRSTREKLMTYLRQQAKAASSRDFIIPYDRQALADYLGVDRSGLSSEISKLIREGVIACTRRRFTLLGEIE